MMKIPQKRRRWLVLAVYLGALVLTQFSCYAFAPSLPLVAALYHISTSAAGWTVMIFPLLSALTSGIAGWAADRFGYRFSIRSGLLLIALFSALRACGGGFAFLLLSQAGIAIGIPLVVTALSPLVCAWFDPRERPSVTPLCTVCLFAGIGLALGISPRLILAVRFEGAMVVLAGVAALCCALFFLTVPGTAPQQMRVERRHTSWFSLLRNRNMVILCAGGFLGQGCFNAITTWIAVIWHDRGFPFEAAGIASSYVVFAGILGSLLIPSIADRFLQVRTALWLCLIPAAVLAQPFIWTKNLSSACAYGGIMGFFQLPSLAISLTLLERSVSAEQRGTASGIYWTVGNAGVLVLSYMIDLMHRISGWHVAVDCVTALLIVVILLVAFLRVPARAARSVSLSHVAS
jgi:FLVCR family feline leukemia virus subgroup C receptor-related protein